MKVKFSTNNNNIWIVWTNFFRYQVMDNISCSILMVKIHNTDNYLPADTCIY